MAKRGRKLFWTPRRVEALVRTVHKYCKEKLEETFHDYGTEKSPKLIGPKIASIEDFCKRRKICHSTISGLSKNYPELEAAIKKLVRVRNEMLIQFGMAGIYSTVFAIFAAKNLMDWKDTPLIDQSKNEETHYHMTIDKMAERLAQHKANQEKDGESIERAGSSGADGVLPPEPSRVLENRLGGITLGQAGFDHGSGEGQPEGNSQVS